jgi:acid phosphatase type 7
MRLILCIVLAFFISTTSDARDVPKNNLLAGAKPQFHLAAEETPEWKDELPTEPGPVRARWRFSLEKAGDWQSLTLQSSPSIKTCTLNGARVTLPVSGMHYATLPGISPKLLKTGENTLQVEFRNKAASAAVALEPLTAAELDFQTEPVLGDAGSHYFTVGCRTNMPAQVTLEIGDKTWESPEGLVHTFRPTRLHTATEQSYTLTARIAGGSVRKQIGPFHTKTLPRSGQPLRFAALGDSRTYPKDWARVAAAVVAKHPMFVLFSGDMVADGREDRLWDEQFFSVARPYHASIPNFYVNGNHEDRSPLVGSLLPIANRIHWKKVIGDTLFIGIDGAADWSEKGENLKWLESTLKASQESFIFLNSHYPPWSSGPHGAGNESTSLIARKNILPLMKKYGATAFLAGHEHNYERCEPPEGVTVIVSGGAGAPLYPKLVTSAQNPYSKVFASVHNFCLFTIDGGKCTMQALTPDGKVLDNKIWPARQRN